MASLRRVGDPRRIAVEGGLGVTAALFGVFLVATWRALAAGEQAVTEVVFTLTVFLVAGLFFLSTVEDARRSATQGPIAAVGVSLGVALAVLAPPIWSAFAIVQLLTYPFVLLWIFALVATQE